MVLVQATGSASASALRKRMMTMTTTMILVQSALLASVVSLRVLGLALGSAAAA